MIEGAAQAFTKGCFSGEFASCSYACPLHLDIRSFIEKVQRGSWTSAYRVLRDGFIFPDIVVELCEHSCQEHCARKLCGDPINICELEKACLRYVKSKEAISYNIPAKPNKIAIVGAGLSGLACALRLSVKKFQVTVFDSNDGYGGILRDHPKAELFLEDIKRQFAKEKVDFRFNTRIESLDMPEFGAIYLATGKGGDDFGLLDSWNPKTFATAKHGVFMGGMLVGVGLLQSIDHGAIISRQIEKFLPTGTVYEYVDEYPIEKSDRYINVENKEPADLALMSNADGYTAEEAIAEAKRCFRCDCKNCLETCEMLDSYHKIPSRMANDVYKDSLVMEGFSSRVITREISSCNMCGLCKTGCPTAVDISDLVLFARRDRVEHGNYPKAFHDFWLRQMDTAINEGSAFLAPEGHETCSFAFFPGCQLGASNPDYTKESYALLTQQLNSDVGLMLSCCGAPAYWAGEEEKHQKIIEKIRNEWEKLGQPVVIFACATCARVWQQFIPEANIVSLYEMIKQKPHQKGKPFVEEAAVFDPCKARENSQMRTSVRSLATDAGIKLNELQFHDEKAKCCGWGGHIQAANKELFDKIVTNRIEAADLPYIVYCANCRDVFAAKGKRCLHILDVVFGLDDGSRQVPNIKERRDNSLKLKQDLLKQYWNIDYQIPVLPGEDLQLDIPPELVQKMEEQMISETTVRAAIAHAEESNEKMFDPQDNTYISSYIEGEFTCWVRYSQDDEGKYKLHKVYSHRMKFTV